MTQTTDFTNFATEHPKYFAGQYLLEEDFRLQHKYLSDRFRYQNQSLHVSGIIEGLEVEVGQEEKAVLIKSGAAIDNQGNLIVLKENTTFAEFKNINQGELYIQYSENEDEQQQKEVLDSYTRWKEEPILGFAASTPETGVKLAKITLSDGTITELVADVRDYSGLSLPNSNGKALTLRSGGNDNPNLAVLTGSLNIDQDLTVDGKLGIGTKTPGAKLEISGDLKLQEGVAVNSISNDVNLQDHSDQIVPTQKAIKTYADTKALLAGSSSQDFSAKSLTISGDLTVSEQMVIKDGNVGIGTTNPNNKFHVKTSGAVGIFESSSDVAFLKFLTNEGEENRVEIINRPGGRLSFWTPSGYDVLNITKNGNVGIGTTTPGAKLEVIGELKLHGMVEVLNGDIIDNGEIRAKTIRVDEMNPTSHINVDGAFYRYQGQVYITVDDHLYIRNHVHTVFHFDLNSSQMHIPSDENQKKNIQPIEKGLQKILNLSGVTFQWKDDESSGQENTQMGLIAQEVEKVFPEIVQTDQDGMKMMSYTGLIAPIIQAIKEQQKQISNLLKQLEEQKTQLKQLSSKFS